MTYAITILSVKGCVYNITHLCQPLFRLVKTRAILKQLKEEFQVGSVNEVILKLLSERGDGNQHPIIDDEPEAMDEDIEIVKNAKLQPGLLWTSLCGDVKSVKHFTGLKAEPYAWVETELVKAVRRSCFFVFRVSRACERFGHWALLLFDAFTYHF